MTSACQGAQSQLDVTAEIGLALKIEMFINQGRIAKGLHYRLLLRRLIALLKLFIEVCHRNL